VRSANILVFSSLVLSCLGTAQETTFHTESNVVLIPTLVKNAQGRAVYGLQAKDFVVEDDGVAQTAELDETAESEPVSLVIAVQSGRQANREFPRLKGLRSMIRPILDQDQNLTAVVEFDSGIQLVQDFTDDEKLVDKALQTLQPGDNGACILDAVKYSINRLNQQPPGRQRMLLLISETRDHGSYAAKPDDVLAAIGEGNVVVYALAFSPALSNVLDTGRGANQDDMNAFPDLMAPLILLREGLRKNTPKSISAMTGGEYELFDTRRGFENHLNDFTNHLHSRYLLSFQPKDPHSGPHRLRVRLREPAKGEVLARGSYWAAGAGH
jgi:VWFA-related protein